MLRICARNSYVQCQNLLNPILFKEVTKNLKSLDIAQKSISRHYAIKLREKKDKSLERIYYGPLTPQIKAVKVFSLTSSIAGLLAQPIIIGEANTIGSTSLLIALCSVVGFFTFVTPILLHIITRKYVTEMHYDPATSTYKATTINFFMAKKQLEFKQDDVDVPELPGMFTTMKAKGKPLFVEARHFNDPSHYAKIMGYDKPMDFKLGDNTQETSK